MTFDDLDTWWVTYSQFVGADSKSGISFALNNDLKAQGSCKLRIITAEMSYGNGPWYSWPCMTLTPGHLYMAPGYPQTPLMLPGVQKHTLESSETRPDTIDRKICRFRPNMTWHNTSYLPDLTSQEVNILRECVQLINARILKVSWRYNAFYATYLRKTFGGGPFNPPPLHVRGLKAFFYLLTALVTPQYTPKIHSQIFQTLRRSARR